MTTYIVQTRTAGSYCMLHSTFEGDCSKFKDNFSTNNLQEAIEVFKKEVACLEKNYRKINDFDYEPSQSEIEHALFCEIIDSESLETVEFEGVELISEYYFE